MQQLLQDQHLYFENIQAGSYQVSIEYLGGRRQQQQVATSAAILKTQVMMPINSVAFVKLIKTAQ